MKSFFACVGAVAIAIALLARPAIASSGTLTLAASSTATATMPAGGVSSSCAFTIAGTFVGTIALKPQMPDLSTPGPNLPFIGNNTSVLSVSAPGTYQANVAQLQNAIFFWSAYSSGSASISFSCGTTVVRSGGGGGGAVGSPCPSIGCVVLQATDAPAAQSGTVAWATATPAACPTMPTGQGMVGASAVFSLGYGSNLFSINCYDEMYFTSTYPNGPLFFMDAGDGVDTVEGVYMSANNGAASGFQWSQLAVGQTGQGAAGVQGSMFFMYNGAFAGHGPNPVAFDKNGNEGLDGSLALHTLGSATISSLCGAIDTLISQCAPTPTNTPYGVVVQSYGPKHWYKLGDTGTHGPNSNCPATFADSGSVPVALTTPNPGPSAYCGSLPLTIGSTGSIQLNGAGTGDYLVLPNGAAPSSSPSPAAWTIVVSLQATGTQTGSSTPNFYTQDTNNHLNLSCQAQGNIGLYNGSTFNSGGSANGCNGLPTLVGFTYTANPNTLVMWADGAPAGFATPNLSNQNTAGQIGNNTGCSCAYAGRMADLWILYGTTSSAVLQQADWEKLWFAFRCGGKAVGSCV